MGRLAELFRKKLARMEDKLYQLSASTQSKIKTQRLSYEDQHHVPQMNKKSSWVRSYAWDDHTHTLYMTTQRGQTYSWANIDFATSEKVKAGLAICRTSDPTGQNRWFVGKHPSLGAAFWQILKPLTRTATVQPSPLRIQDMRANMMESGWIDPKPGRPPDKLRRYNRFHKLALYDKIKKGVGA